MYVSVRNLLMYHEDTMIFRLNYLRITLCLMHINKTHKSSISKATKNNFCDNQYPHFSRTRSSVVRATLRAFSAPA